ncbi:MAG: hypothetical protein ACRCVX_16570 [Shewanella sp.]
MENLQTVEFYRETVEGEITYQVSGYFNKRRKNSDEDYDPIDEFVTETVFMSHQDDGEPEEYSWSWLQKELELPTNWLDSTPIRESFEQKILELYEQVQKSELYYTRSLYAA